MDIETLYPAPASKELRDGALAALAEVTLPEDEPRFRLTAVKLLRDATDKRYTMREYVAAVLWAQRERDAERPIGPARAALLAAFARRVVALDDSDPASAGYRERRTVTMTQLVGWAREALGELEG